MALSALTASATLPPRYRQWSSLLPGFPGQNRTRFSFRASSKWKGSAGLVACGASVENAGFTEISDAESPQRLYTWPDNKKPRICILGGGFGGLYTALRLESLVWPDDKRPQVLLVDQFERFCFKPMLYELLSGEVDKWEIAPRFTDLLASTSVLFFQDKVKSLHPSDHFVTNGTSKSACGGSIRLESGLLIEYDWLVLALGAETKLDLVPGAADFALPFSTLEDALRVDLKLKTLERSNFGKNSLIRVTVVGCGYAGVELAATVSERLQERGTVQAINSEMTICPQASPGNREVAMKILSNRKVELLLGYFVRSISRVESETEDDSIGHELEKYVLDLQPSERGVKGQIVETDLVLWTVGSKPLLPETEPRERPYELPLNARGQTETDETLRVKGHPRIFAVGDSSSLRDSNGNLLPATAQVAFQQADFAGWNLWAAINNRPLLPFRFQNLGEMMTLGRSDAALSPSFIDGLTIEGPIGHTARKLAYLARLPTDEHRLKVGASWFAKTAIDSISLVQSTLFKILSSS